MLTRWKMEFPAETWRPKDEAPRRSTHELERRLSQMTLGELLYFVLVGEGAEDPTETATA
jgi:hypothetical protein